MASLVPIESIWRAFLTSSELPVSCHRLLPDGNPYEQLARDLHLVIFFLQISLYNGNSSELNIFYTYRSLDPELLAGPMSDHVRVIHISKNPLLEVADLRLFENVKRTDLMVTMIENNIKTVTPPSKPSNIYSLNLGRNAIASVTGDMLRNLLGVKYLYFYEVRIFFSHTLLSYVSLHYSTILSKDKNTYTIYSNLTGKSTEIATNSPTKIGVCMF